MTDTPAERGPENPWDRLRRRKVVQWALAYAAGAWALLQALAFAADTFGWPPIVKQVATLGLVVGLPVALVLAWYHGERAQQRVTRQELAILTVLLLIGGGGLLWWYADHRAEAPTTVASSTPIPSTVTDTRPSIAVLPFENRSADHHDDYLVDGMHDDILTQLSKIGAIKVTSRSSVERLRHTSLSTQQIAAQLRVTAILEGQVQRFADNVRVDVQLIDAATDSNLWGESYDRKLSAANLFAIQGEVAAAIAGALKATLTSAERSRTSKVQTRNLNAWGSYQLGRQRLAARTATAFSEAEASFRKAIRQDPDFALAYAGLADALALSVGYTSRSDKPVQQARDAANQALRLDPELPEAWVSAGIIAGMRGEASQAAGMYRRAIELDPNNALAYKFYGQTQLESGNDPGGVSSLQKAATLDPLSAVIQVNLGDAFSIQGMFDAAAACFQRAITLDPAYANAYDAYAGLLKDSVGHIAEAEPLLRKAIELDPHDPYRTLLLADFYYDLGVPAEYEKLMSDAANRWPENPFVQTELAAAALLRGDEASATQHAAQALKRNPGDEDALGLLTVVDLRHGRMDAALTRYKEVAPELLGDAAPMVDMSNASITLAIALLLQRSGDRDRALALLAGVERFTKGRRRAGPVGFGITDAMIFATRGENAKALAALREAQKAGWHSGWTYYRDFEPAFDSIRKEPAFKAIFADIERDMATQRAALAVRPRDAPLDLAATGM